MEGGWPFMPAWCLICAALLACLSPAQPTKSLDLSLTLTNNVIHVNDVPEHLLTMYPVCTRGVHPYRRRQSGSVLQAFQNVCIGNQVSCLHEIHGYNRLPWPHPVDPIVRRIKSAGKLFEDRGE